MLKNKQVKDFDVTLFSDIDWSQIKFVETFNQGQNRTLYDKLHAHYYDYFLVFGKERLQNKIQMRLDEEADYLNELYDTTQYEYNPIENYNMKEDSTDNTVGEHSETKSGNVTDSGTIKRTGTDSTSSTFSNMDTGTDTNTHTGTENNSGTFSNKDTGTDTNKQTGTDTTDITSNNTATHTGTEGVETSTSNTETGSVFPMTISTAKDKDKTVGSGTSDSTRTVNLTDEENKDETHINTKDLTDTRTLNLTHSGENESNRTLDLVDTKTLDLTHSGENTSTQTLDLLDTNNNTKTEEGNVSGETQTETTHSLTRSGNIGVTTTQQMIESQRKILLCMFKEVTLILNDYFFLDDEYMDD